MKVIVVRYKGQILGQIDLLDSRRGEKIDIALAKTGPSGGDIGIEDVPDIEEDESRKRFRRAMENIVFSPPEVVESYTKTGITKFVWVDPHRK